MNSLYSTEQELDTMNTFTALLLVLLVAMLCSITFVCFLVLAFSAYSETKRWLEGVFVALQGLDKIADYKELN